LEAAVRRKPRGVSDVEIALEAAAWLVRRVQDDFDDRAKAEFEAWLRTSERHGAIYRGIESTWGEAGPAGVEIQAEERAGTSRRRVIQGIVGVTAACGFVSGGWAVSELHPLADHRTGRAERRAVTLADGSAVELAASTVLSLAFTAAERRVILHAGEAWFQVAPDGDRAFVVQAARGETVALGTAFNVRREPRLVVVTVTEHEVRVAARGREANVLAGHQVSYGDAQGISATRAVNASNAVAWRTGRLVFLSRPLREVLDAIEPWTSSRIFLTDEALGDQLVTVAVEIERSAEILAALGRSLGIRVRCYTPYVALVGP
jgi:transmembrane sensor